MAQRLDQVTTEEWAKIKAALPIVVAKKTFMGSPMEALGRAHVVLDTLWATGCHPVVLADPKAHNVALRGSNGDWAMTWRRPKKRGLAGYCSMPIDDELRVRLEAYLSGPWYSRKTIWKYTTECAKEAKVDGVTPRTIRHTVGWRIFKALGASAAKESLNVSDRVLQYYLAMDSKTRLREVRKVMEAAQNEKG